MLRICSAILLLCATATVLQAGESEENGINDIAGEDYVATEGNANDTMILNYCMENHDIEVIRACRISETSADAIVTCAKELHIMLPCFLLSIMERGDWEKCSEIEEPETVWENFTQELVDKCLVRCIWQKLGFMNEAGQMREESHIKYLNEHYANKNGRGSDMTVEEKANLQACMDAPLPVHPFPFANLTKERDPSCELAEHSLVCSEEAIDMYVMSCIKEECYLHHQKDHAIKSL